jgi:L-rhamnose isomerase
MNHKFYSPRHEKHISEQSQPKQRYACAVSANVPWRKKEDLQMLKTFAAAIMFSTIALGPFAAFADSNTNSANKQTEATEAPAAAANKQTEDSVAKKCADILAHKADHTAAEVAACPK